MATGITEITFGRLLPPKWGVPEVAAEIAPTSAQKRDILAALDSPIPREEQVPLPSASAATEQA